MTVNLCVRARMTKNDQEIMFTENNFVVQHSTGGKFSSVTMNVDRKANIEVREDLEDSVKVTAYQCDSSHNKITSPAPIAQGKALLRICVKGVEAKYSCAGIPTATLKQCCKVCKFVCLSQNRPPAHTHFRAAHRWIFFALIVHSWYAHSTLIVCL